MFKLAARTEAGFVSLFLPDFVGQYGQDNFELSMQALKTFTKLGSAEFAVREFLRSDLTASLSVMRDWSLDEDEHVRRLASEGSRPRLPWSFKLDPTGNVRHMRRQLIKDFSTRTHYCGPHLVELIPAINHIANELDCSFWYWAPSETELPCKYDKPPGANWSFPLCWRRYACPDPNLLVGMDICHQCVNGLRKRLQHGNDGLTDQLGCLEGNMCNQRVA